MRRLEDLKEGDYIVFYDKTDGLIVDNITSISKEGRITVHYLYDGYKSTHATFPKKEVLAIGNEQGKGKIQGLRGNYDILQPEKLEKALEQN